MSLKSLAFALCGFLALSATACRDRDFEGVRRKVIGNEALWLRVVLAAEVRLPETGPTTRMEIPQLLERAASVPGVEQVAVTDALPGALASRDQVPIECEGFPSDRRPAGYVHVVSSGYFPTMGLHLFKGRLFSNSDGEYGPLVAIINESFARRIHEDSIGRRVRFASGSGPWVTIVGIVQDGPRVRHSPEVYIPYTQQALYGPRPRAGAPTWYMLARAPGDQEAVSAHLRQVVGSEFLIMEDRLNAYSKAHEPD
jgi:MacB-like periplasmic core domain